LLDAAGEIFAEYGYRAATVRQICEKAGANVAAVNYYFGDKDKLYMAVLRLAHKSRGSNSRGGFPAVDPKAPAEQRLRSYVASLLSSIFAEGRPGWHFKLITREMMEPTRALDTIVKEAARPIHQELGRIVGEILGANATEKLIRLGTLSILGQTVYYLHARPIIARLYPGEKYGPESIADIADHISRFSILALTALSKNSSGWKADRKAGPKSKRAKHQRSESKLQQSMDLHSNTPARMS
jgi:AcrR family transcriptional regulator